MGTQTCLFPWSVRPGLCPCPHLCNSCYEWPRGPRRNCCGGQLDSCSCSASWILNIRTSFSPCRQCRAAVIIQLHTCTHNQDFLIEKRPCSWEYSWSWTAGLNSWSGYLPLPGVLLMRNPSLFLRRQLQLLTIGSWAGQLMSRFSDRNSFSILNKC